MEVSHRFANEEGKNLSRWKEDSGGVRGETRRRLAIRGLERQMVDYTVDRSIIGDLEAV